MTLTPLVLPADADAATWSVFLAERAGGELARAQRTAEELRAIAPGDDAALTVWNEIGIALGNASAVTSLLAQVHPDAGVRQQAEDLSQEISRVWTDLLLDVAVYERLAAVDADGLDERLGDGAQRVLADALRSYRRSGIDADEPTRERLRAISERLTDLGQAFGRTIRDGAGETRVPASALEGLPADYVEAHPVQEDGTVVIGTGYPDTNPFLTFSLDRDARHAVHATFLDLGWPGNDAVLAEMLRLRQEQAELLGYASWPDFDAEVKMIGTGSAIAEFIDQITADATPAAERDRDVLLARARQDHPDLHTLDVTDARFYSEVVRREQYEVDAQEVRSYFTFAKVRQGLLDLTGRLFGLTYTDVPDAPVWHEEVSVHDVWLDGERLGRIHLDLHPREGKYNHAAQFDLVPGVAGVQLPEGVLVCNFGRGRMEHSEVTTLFHEFGHLMHHILAGRHRWVRFSGVATEWDFVEAPSQMLEEWAWDAGVLQTFATDDDGTPIPVELVARMRSADEFGQGCYARTQMYYASVSYRFHAELPADQTARLRELSAQYAIFDALPDTHFHCGFGHLSGYTSAYYTYMWSLVIAKDLFSAFDPDDLFAPEVATRYRDTVLAAGGSKDAADLVADFLGRPYDSAAFRRWLTSS
ncbi:M3 family metallopeptidase [Nocardioides fonticola]|uniref:M3 family metallopeptidase n=1 Tax=Nocardioides fonticola TaxID=450363 RepID=A0ABP7XZV4_9ACTN